MAPLRAMVLPKMGLVQAIKNSLLYGPLRYQGLGLTYMYIIPYTRNIAQIVGGAMPKLSIRHELVHPANKVN